ncbi:MAG TPA: hypothetical protein VGC97_15995 [Pyrinomonadaceae bacterium]|jgi:tetratricopeptide (TPR) repeat protein
MVRDSLAFLNNLMAEGESSPDLLEDIAAGYEKVAYVQSNIYESNLSRVDAAIENYRKALAIRRSLVADERLKQSPDDAQAKRDLSVSYRAVGFNLKGRRQFEAAWDYSQKSLDLLLELSAIDPAPYQPNIAQAFRLLGDNKTASGEMEKAIPLYKQAITVGEKLVADFNGDFKLKTNLALTYESLTLREEIKATKQLLRWKEAAIKRITQSLEKCS